MHTPTKIYVAGTEHFFAHCECTVIPNIIDHSVFYPKDKNAARNLLWIPRDKTVIGFGAAYDIDNPKSMKGSFYLLEALAKLKNPEKYFLVIFGPAGETFTSKVTLPFFASGYVANPAILASIYSLCDKETVEKMVRVYDSALR